MLVVTGEKSIRINIPTRLYRICCNKRPGGVTFFQNRGRLLRSNFQFKKLPIRYYMNFRWMILRVCNVDFGNNFTSLPSLPCQYQKILNLISLPKISQDSIKNWAIFYQFVGNFKRGRLLDRGLYYSKYGTYVFRSLDMKVMTISKFKFWCQWGWCAHVSLAITNMGIATIFSFLCCLEVKISARNTF